MWIAAQWSRNPVAKVFQCSWTLQLPQGCSRLSRRAVEDLLVLSLFVRLLGRAQSSSNVIAVFLGPFIHLKRLVAKTASASNQFFCSLVGVANVTALSSRTLFNLGTTLLVVIWELTNLLCNVLADLTVSRDTAWWADHSVKHLLLSVCHRKRAVIGSCFVRSPTTKLVGCVSETRSMCS